MTHGLIILLVVAILCVIALVLVFQRLATSSKKAHPYLLKPSLFTPAEKSFLECLDAVLSPDIRIFAKVRLADLFSVEKTVDRSAWQSAFNKINSKHVDFVLCRANELSPLLAIELDDKSHTQENRQQRDIFINELFASSSLPLLRFKVQKAYQPEAIAQRINEALA